MAMIDTDYASEPQGCGPEDELSDDMKERRANAGLGHVANKNVGLAWRSPDVRKAVPV